MIKFPYCKINIGLEILRKRDDGYHDIRTVMYPVPWTDILEIVPAAGATDTLTVTGNAVDCPPEQNLVMKAVRALREVAEFPPYEIYLHKIIPDGAGLGGGSSDAAIAVVMLNDMNALGLSDEDPRCAQRRQSRLTPENAAMLKRFEAFLLYEQAHGKH